MSNNSNFAAKDEPEFSTRHAQLKTKPVGEIQHDHQLTEQIGQLLYNDSCSDVTLIVDGTSIAAHKVILSARSTYFWAMFYGGMRESTAAEVTLTDTPAHVFCVLLKYIYSGRIQLSAMNLDLILDVLSLVHKYGFLELETAIADYLKAVLNHQNVFSIYSTAFFFSIDTLVGTCLDYFDNNAPEILESVGFETLGAPPLVRLIERNSFSAPELDIFRAVRRWTSAHPNESDQFPVILGKIRLALIKLKDLIDVVRPTGLITPDQLLDAINEQIQSKNYDLVYRGLLIPDVNIATSDMGAKVNTGYGRFEPLSNALVDMDGSLEQGIVVELGRCSIINHIQLNLGDREQLAYFVEVSVDREDWICVADYSHAICRSRQKLFFRERVVKYIRVMAPRTGNVAFGIAGLSAMYSTEPFTVDPDTKFLVPQENVATIPRNAIVVEGVSRSRNALLNGETKNYDWDNGYTCHELGSGSIIVQLPQPYLLDSMRLLLWDCDDRIYSFYIEVSINHKQWIRVADIKQARSWQTLRFKRTAAVFIKIVGTQNSANDVFHCVHFECPATTTDDEDNDKKLAEKLEVANLPVDVNKPSVERNVADNEDDKVKDECEPLNTSDKASE